MSLPSRESVPRTMKILKRDNISPNKTQANPGTGSQAELESVEGVDKEQAYEMV